MKKQLDSSVSVPNSAFIAINRCNLPARILGSLTFQHSPSDLYIDGVTELHQGLFDELDKIESSNDRASAFCKYMSAFFSLDELKETGKLQSGDSYTRVNANYLRLLRGWMFNSSNLEGAVIKGWTESRFGLLTRWHKKKICHPDEQAYTVFMHERTTGVYNTNAIESQLDLLYTYCQYELRKNTDNTPHYLLYRGIDALNHYDIVDNSERKKPIILLNNINSLSRSRERADEFGTTVFSIEVPIQKIFYYDGLIPGLLQGESENIVIGGIYEVNLL